MLIPSKNLVIKSDKENCISYCKSFVFFVWRKCRIIFARVRFPLRKKTKIILSFYFCTWKDAKRLDSPVYFNPTILSRCKLQLISVQKQYFNINHNSISFYFLIVQIYRMCISKCVRNITVVSNTNLNSKEKLLRWCVQLELVCIKNDTLF